MVTHVFAIDRPDPESLNIYLDDESIAYMTHDSVGWDGMEMAESLISNIAKVLKIEVIETNGNGE